MAQLEELLLGVWREAGRHSDITTATAQHRAAPGALHAASAGVGAAH